MGKDYILVTGGAGYIGSHTVVELIENGYNIVIVDDLKNSDYDTVAIVECIVKQQIPFFNIDMNDYNSLLSIFHKYNVKSVIHFAEAKNNNNPIKNHSIYLNNNMEAIITLIRAMEETGIKIMMLSHHIGHSTNFPIQENHLNPYEHSLEHILLNIISSDQPWKVAVLHYSNPIGAHSSGIIGGNSSENILLSLSQTATGKKEKLYIFGNNYKSHDGTPIRDYIHVVDLARGHASALKYLQKLDDTKNVYKEWNLGTGKGSSVFDIYHIFCKVVGINLSYEIVRQCENDMDSLVVDPTKANAELNWQPKFTVSDACHDMWK